jgi:fatty-acyl-CoA synthase
MLFVGRELKPQVEGLDLSGIRVIEIRDTGLGDDPYEIFLANGKDESLESLMEYFLQPEATAKAFLGGWFHSGDLAVWHPDGYIELRDRLKDIIISGGENISTIEIEQLVARHPAVLECAVVAIPDEKWGERPKAFVVLKRDATASEEDILTFRREHAAHFKCPVAVEFGELPKTSTGKIQKYILREREWRGKVKRIN